MNLQSKFASQYEQIGNIGGVSSDQVSSTYGTLYWFKNNRIIVVTADLYINSQIADGTEIATLPKPAYNNHFVGILINTTGSIGRVSVDSSTGKLKANGTIAAIGYAKLSLAYVSES